MDKLKNIYKTKLKSNKKFNFLLTKTIYLLILEPFEEILRERRNYYTDKEKNYKLSYGSLNSFWLNLKNYYSKNFDEYVLIEVEGLANKLFIDFLKVRFAFSLKGSITL